MKAAKISHTVEFEKPDSAQVRPALAGLNPALARSAGPNRTYGREERHQRDADQADGRAGQRFEHQADDHAREDGEEVPRVLREAFRRWDERQHDRDRDR